MATEDQLSERKIYVTKDYSKFHLIKGNRTIKPNKVKRMKESIRKYKQYVPIIVTKDFGIIDGQHKFMAARELGLPIEYIIDPDLTVKDIQEMNTEQTKWALLDAIHSHASLENHDFINLEKLYADYGHKFQISTLLGIISPSAYNLSIREGTYKFTDEMYLKTKGVLAKLSEIKELFPQANTLKFARTYARCLKIQGFSHDRFMNQLPKVNGVLKPNMKDRDFYGAIDKVYNFGKKIESVLEIEVALIKRK